MNYLSRLALSRNVPNDIHVVIEIPMQGNPVKYEVDKATGALLVDRFLGTAMYYPCNYGYIPGTLSADGDPLDVLVPAPFPLLAASIIHCRPIGLLKMEDESGLDAKILAVPVDKISPLYRHIQAPDDLPQSLLSSITHFFEHYKDLEEGKWVKVVGWMGAEDAKAEILASVARCHEYSNKRVA